jgi:Mn2+/Fe2+ NRAMP family transporter
VIGTVIAVIPGVPVIGLLVGVQVVNGFLLPVTLFFVWRLASNRELMGDHRNGRIFNVIAAATVLGASTLSILLVVITIHNPFGR